MTTRAPRKIVVTGAGGFVGTHLCTALAAQGHDVSRIVRRGASTRNTWVIDDLASTDIPAAAFDGADVLVHLAASLPNQSGDPNTRKTVHIAQRVAATAQKHKVGRVIVLSSIAARLAQENAPDKRPYGQQKHAAELAFSETLGAQSKCVFLRPPVIYGPNARGSFALLSKLVQRGLPLPLRAATAPRCYLSTANLCTLIETLTQAPDAAWHSADRLAFEPHDGYAVSTKDLAQMLASCHGKNLRMLPFPKPLLRRLAGISGRADQVDAMFEPLMCRDTPSLQDIFGWRADETMPASLSFLRG